MIPADAQTDWDFFEIAPEGWRPDPPRAITSPEGVGDRLRAAAFAEIQARDAFLWAADHFEGALPDLRRAWRTLAAAEQKHLNWLLNRMRELGIDVKARKVSTFLWYSLKSCKTAREFATYMAGAEERGQKAGFRFYETLKSSDAITAAIFQKIAEEETSHIELAARFFPESGPQLAPVARVEQGSTRGPEV